MFRAFNIASTKMLDYVKRIDLKLRKQMLRVFNLIVPLASRTGITKVQIGDTNLGKIALLLFNKALNFKPSQPIKVNGMTMYHRASSERGWWGWYYAFDYEPQTSYVFEQIAKPKMTIVDVGAHIGYYSLLAAKCVGGEGKVYAFEPDPLYYSLLVKNINSNALDRIVEPFRLAIGDVEKKTTIFLGKSTGTSFFKIPDITQTAVVDVITLDRFFEARGWPPVHLVKMDIEGAEKAGLEGMSKLVRRNQNLKLIIELNSPFLEVAGTTAEELLCLLAGLGFNRICVLSEKMGFYKIPQDIQYLATLGRKLKYVNLLCERHFEVYGTKAVIK